MNFAGPLLLAVVVFAPVQGSADRVHTSERFGFRIARPDDTWAGYAADGGSAGTRHTLTLYARGSQGIPSVVVYVSDAGAVTDAAIAREVAAKKLEEKGATGIERGSTALAGGEAPFVRATMPNPLGGTMEVQCVESIEHGFLYTLQCVRATDDAASQAKIDAAVASFALFEPKEPVVSPERAAWKALAAKCAGDLPWASSWTEAAKRAREEKKLVLVLFQNYAPLALPDTLRTGALMDPDFASLLRERFVVLRLGTRDEAPFRDARIFGMGTHAFGTAYLFVEPDGRVAAECGVSDASFLDAFAREVLGKAKGVARAGRGDGSALERAQALVRRGELASAEQALADTHTAAAHRLRAAILRRQRKGAEALDEIHAAKRVASAELEPELACDEAVLLMRTQRYLEAAAAFERVASKWPDHPRADEAAFWLGAFGVLSAGVEAGSGRWKSLAAAHPDSPWAWKAAANLLGEGSFVNGVERIDWPEPDLVACASKPRVAPLALAEAARAEREAVAWLVANQREDGSWWNPTDGFSVGANLYTPACSAICAQSLLAHVEAKGARAGAEKMTAYALALLERGRLKASEDLAGVYSIWNRTFVAWTFARALRAGVGDEKKLAKGMQELVDSVVASQDRRGGWPYIRLPGDADGSGIDPSASFLTAGVLLALLETREAGAKVQQEAIDGALAFLDGLREKDGTYRYLPDLPGTLVDGVHPEACGRGPVCALALFRGGRGGTDLLQSALDLFLAHRSEFKAEWHKELCHTSPEGFGSHYLFYDYLFAASAARALPREVRERYRGPILADVLAARLADGSFQDMPGLGRPYATAMAVLALRQLDFGSN
jgi:tetratricopeptide (TPR) repeat protein